MMLEDHSYLVADTIRVKRIVVPASLPSNDSPLREMLASDAVLVATGRTDALLALSSDELRVLLLVDGRRPLARIGAITGIADDDRSVAVALLASKGLV